MYNPRFWDLRTYQDDSIKKWRRSDEWLLKCGKRHSSKSFKLALKFHRIMDYYFWANEQHYPDFLNYKKQVSISIWFSLFLSWLKKLFLEFRYFFLYLRKKRNLNYKKKQNKTLQDYSRIFHPLKTFLFSAYHDAEPGSYPIKEVLLKKYKLNLNSLTNGSQTFSMRGALQKF